MREASRLEIYSIFWLLVVFALAGCASSPPGDLTDREAPVAQEIPHQLLQKFSIDPTSSSILIFAYPDGPLARFGHKHLIAVRLMEGDIELNEPLAASKLALRFPVADLSVDDPLLRQHAGDEFSAPVPDKDRAGTRANMLSPALLNAEQHPHIDIIATRITGNWPNLIADVHVDIAGSRHELMLEALVEQNKGWLDIRSRFSLKHSDLGLQVFSAMLGALKVRDSLDFEVRLRARAVD